MSFISSLPGKAGTGAATGASIGSVVPGLGTLVGAAIGAVVGTLMGVKGKTPHMSWNDANTVALKVTDVIVTGLTELNPSLNFRSTSDPVCISFKARATTLLRGRVNPGSKSWQDSLDSVLKNEMGPNAAFHAALWGLIIYVALNYDASRPEEFDSATDEFLTIIFKGVKQDIPRFNDGSVVAQSAGTGGQKKIENQNFVEGAINDIFGSPNNNAPVSSPPPTAQAGFFGSSTIQIILAFILLGAVIWYATKKGK